MNTTPDGAAQRTGGPAHHHLGHADGGSVADGDPVVVGAGDAGGAGDLNAGDLNAGDLNAGDLNAGDLNAGGAGTGAELDLEPATAYAIEGYEPRDPWNAVLCVEGRTTEVVLELTPTHLDRLVAGLSEVREAQRAALGAASAAGSVDENEPQGEDQAAGQHIPDRGPGLERVVHAARMATGSAPVARLWNSGTRGRLVIIGGALMFVLLGVILSVVSQYR